MLRNRPHYPARFVGRAMNFPERYCGACGARLVPRLHGRPGGRLSLERPSVFRKRVACDHECRGVLHGLRLRKAGRLAVPGSPHLTDRVMGLLVEYQGMPLKVADFVDVLSADVEVVTSALRTLVRSGREVGRREDPDAKGFLYFWKPTGDGNFHHPNGEAVLQS